MSTKPGQLHRNAARTFAVAVATFAPAAVAEAHSGGLDKNCGHAGSRPYHRHLDGACGARLRARQARQQPERGIDRSNAEWRAAKAAAPVVEDGATFRSDLWLLARHGSWTSGTDEDGGGVIAVAEDGLRLEVHCSPGDDEGRPEHANWLAAVISDDGEYFVSGPPEDRRAALLLGTGARMIAQAAARGRQPLEIHLGSERKTFPTAGADRAAARALEPGTACDWSSDADLTFDAPSTEGLRAGGMALAGTAAASAGQPGRTRLDDALLWGIGVAMISGGFLVGVAGVCCWWRERAAKRQRPAAGAVRRAEPPRDPNRPMPSPASPRPRPAPSPPPASAPASLPIAPVRRRPRASSEYGRGGGYAGRNAAQWAALQRAGWQCQLCGRGGISGGVPSGRGNGRRMV